MSRLFWLAPAVALGAASIAAGADPLPPDTTYRPLPTLPFSAVKRADEAQKPKVMERQAATLKARYDLADRPMAGVMMSGGRKPVQADVRVKLPQGATWESLAALAPAEIRQKGLLPEGFKPLPHVKHATGGSRTGRSTRSRGRSNATCAASMSTSTCRIT
jgi:cytochrome c peroxidase